MRAGQPPQLRPERESDTETEGRAIERAQVDARTADGGDRQRVEVAGTTTTTSCKSEAKTRSEKWSTCWMTSLCFRRQWGHSGHPSYRRYHYAKQAIAVDESGQGTRFISTTRSVGQRLTTASASVYTARQYDAWGSTVREAPPREPGEARVTGTSMT